MTPRNTTLMTIFVLFSLISSGCSRSEMQTSARSAEVAPIDVAVVRVVERSTRKGIEVVGSLHA